jgi:hypothetical protein
LFDSLDYFLAEIVGKIQLTPTQRKSAQESYEAVAKWLRAAESPSLLCHADVMMIPHGSLGTDTPTKPFRYDEFDLDLIVRMILNGGRPPTAAQLYNALFDRVRENDTYKAMATPLERCVRLGYARQFHMDLMPGVPVSPGDEKDHRLYVPEKAISGELLYRIVDPIGLMNWFNVRCLLERVENRDFAERRGSFDVMPIHSDGVNKPPLKMAQQLVKRMRDVYFKQDDDAKKILKSVLILTIAGISYAGERNLYVLVKKILKAIKLATADIRTMSVLNPVCDDEDFTMSLKKKPIRFQKLHGFLDSVAVDWDKLQYPKLGLVQRQMLLESLFGETPAKAVMDEYSKTMERLVQTGNVRVNGSGNLVLGAVAANTTPLKRHQFYGD